MSDLVDVEWDLPGRVLRDIFDLLPPMQLAICSCVAKHWGDSLGEDRFRRKIGLERAWRCVGIEPKKIQCLENRSVSVDSSARWGNKIGLVLHGRELVVVDLDEGSITHKRDSLRGKNCFRFIDGMLACLEKKRKVFILSLPSLGTIATFDAEFKVFAIAEASEYVAIGGKFGNLGLWRKGKWTCEIVLARRGERDKGNKNDVRSLAFVKERGLLVSGDEHGFLDIWSVESCTCVRVLESDWYGIERLDVNEKMIILSSQFGDLTIWELGTKEYIEQVKDISQVAGGACVSLNGEKFCVQSQKGILKLWDLTGETCFRSFDMDCWIVAVFLTNEELVVVTEEAEMFVWDFASDIA